jgi:RNA polymerase sigma-70 factor (ECF subfamily)
VQRYQVPDSPSGEGDIHALFQRPGRIRAVTRLILVSTKMSGMTAPSEFTELLGRARGGDAAALGALLRHVQPWLAQAARRLELDLPDASSADLVQEAWLRAWRSLDDFRGNDAPAFRAWLDQIVRTAGLNAVRHHRAEKRREPVARVSLDSELQGDDRPGPASQAAAEEEIERLQAALAGMPDALDREIVRLHFEGGLSLRQTAERLGMHQESVRRRFHAALLYLENRLRQETGERRGQSP